MKEVPQVVRERLKAGGPASGHPDANELTAFAERSLTGKERNAVLEHLAGCSECRDVIAVATPPSEATTAAPVAVRRPWITWPAFRWGFAAAGVVLVALGITQYRQRMQTSSPAMVATRTVAPEVATAGSDTAAPAAAPAVPAKQEENRFPASNVLTAKAKPDTGQHPTMMATAPPMTPSVHVGSGAGYGNQAAFGPKMPSQFQQQQQQVPARVVPAAPSLVSNQQEASAFKVAPPPPSAVAGQFHDAGEARNEPKSSAAVPLPSPPAEQLFDKDTATTVGKAKEASTQAVAGAAVRIIPQWSISASGALQRSFDGGSSWQAVDVAANSISAQQFAFSSASDEVVLEKSMARAKTADKKAAAAKDAAALQFRAVSANGTDVWAGGSNSALYHSLDGGNLWTRVLPSAGGVSLSGDVISVVFSDSLRGSVTTSTGETWLTADDGQTWRKQ